MTTTILLLLVIAGPALGTHDLSNTYPFQLSLHDDYTLYWRFDNDAQNISFAVRVRTTGWVGFGLSPNRQMPQSDIVIGWVDGNGTALFDDRYAEGRSLPPVDEHQDWFLVRGEEEGGFTTLEFTRNYTSCDNKDRSIQHETAFLVWSWNDQDPPVDGVPARHTMQGSAVANLLGGLTNLPQNPPDAQTFTIGVTNIEIPAVNTTYWCQGFLLPDEIRQQTRYIIKNGISLSPPSNSRYVYRLLIHSCDTLEGVAGQAGPCSSVDRKIASCRRGQIVAAWAVGGGDFIYPENVAFPIGGPGASRYLVIEMHYNNPDTVSGVRDSSGMVFTYTSTRRQHDAGVLQLGQFPSRFMIIPPKATNYTVSGFCSGSFTQQLFPPGGIRIFANTLHTHVLGVGVELSLLRTNRQCQTRRVEEVAIIDRNLNYDSNFQQTVHLPKEVVVLPGDTLSLKCIYQTTEMKGVTLGGLATTDEMCLAYPIYYPKVDASLCLTSPLLSDSYENFVYNHVPSDLQSNFLSPHYASRDRDMLRTTFNQLEWTPAQINGLRDSIYTNGQQFATLRCNTGVLIDLGRYCVPEPCCPYQENNVCSVNNVTACSDRNCTAPKTPPRCGARGAGASSLLSHTFLLTTLAIIAMLVAVL